jgi:hypothetical protein
MDQIKIEPITPANLDLVAWLLQERNDTLPAYTQWKYGQNHGDNSFRGVVATLHGDPVGCFGLVVRDLVLPECETYRCGWFADWYVTTRVRAAGLGTKMLHALSDGYPLIIGHPGPEKARAICLSSGYEPVGFQSRRRLVLRRFDYERTRTRHVVKAAANVLFDVQRTAQARMQATWVSKENGSNGGGRRHVAHFINAREQCRWILTQPVRPDVSRTSGLWQRDGLEVVYVDDRLSEAGCRRRILFTAGRRQFSTEAWRSFVNESRKAGCLYIESFTTSRRLDKAWAACGAWLYPDAPVLMRGRPDLVDKFLFHGCDRENWTYLAGGPGKSQPTRV